MVMARYIIREGTVRGQGRYLAWDVECAPRIGSVWSDTMIKAVYEDRDKAEEIAKKSVVRVTTKSERAVREERDAAVRRANQERTIEDLGEALASAIDERDEAIDERDEAMSKIVETERRAAREAADLVDLSFALECERDEARAKLAEYQAGSLAVRLAEAERERDEAMAVRTSQDAWIDSLGLALASVMDERDGARTKLAEALDAQRVCKWCGDGTGIACSRCAAANHAHSMFGKQIEAISQELECLRAIEEQAKRVARAERWHEWTRHAYRNAYGCEAGAAFDMAREAYRAERRKLAEMVGEGS
jgi:hypothetical protein